MIKDQVTVKWNLKLIIVSKHISLKINKSIINLKAIKSKSRITVKLLIINIFYVIFRVKKKKKDLMFIRKYCKNIFPKKNNLNKSESNIYLKYLYQYIFKYVYKCLYSCYI